MYHMPATELCIRPNVSHASGYSSATTYLAFDAAEPGLSELLVRFGSYRLTNPRK